MEQTKGTFIQVHSVGFKSISVLYWLLKSVTDEFEAYAALSSNYKNVHIEYLLNDLSLT